MRVLWMTAGLCLLGSVGNLGCAPRDTGGGNTSSGSSSSTSSTSSSGGGGTSSSGGGGGSSGAGVGGDGFFPPAAPWNQDISNAPVDAQSNAVITWLGARGWGLGRMQIDFSMEVLKADAATPMMAFTPNADFYDGDCDAVPMPLPPGGALEGEQGYACAGDGDCHLIVHHTTLGRLYEMWRANITVEGFSGGCLAVWDLTTPPPANLRGEGCTSADAAGLPIAPLLFTADEVAAGEIAHAIRFILPNDRIRNRTYVRPGTHATGAASGTTDAPPYGARLRLRQDFPLDTLPNDAARTVARAMQRYGIILADGGNVALTARNDRLSTAKWDTLLGSRDLAGIQVSDFVMVEAGMRYNWTGDCTRNP